MQRTIYCPISKKKFQSQGYHFIRTTPGGKYCKNSCPILFTCTCFIEWLIPEISETRLCANQSRRTERMEKTCYKMRHQSSTAMHGHLTSQELNKHILCTMETVKAGRNNLRQIFSSYTSFSSFKRIGYVSRLVCARSIYKLHTFCSQILNIVAFNVYGHKRTEPFPIAWFASLLFKITWQA